MHLTYFLVIFALPEIVLCFQQGVGPEAVIMASALTQPKSLFRIATPLIHTDPNELNEIVRTTLLGAFAFDDGTYSEPMMYAFIS